MNENIPDKTSSTHSKRKLKITLSILLFLVLISGSSYGTYTWQHRKLVASENSSNQLESKNRLLKSQVSTIQSDDQKTKAELKSYTSRQDYTQSDLGLKVLGTAYVNPFGNGVPMVNGVFVGVNVTLTNPTNADIYIATSTFKLKDSQNNVYPTYSQEYVQNSGLPQGYTKLLDQSIAPKESIKGTVIFQLPNTSVQKFELVNGNHSYTANIN